MTNVARAACAYAGAVFALGFLLGMLRALVLAPRWGELAAVGAELPPMLLASWFICRALLRRWPLARAGRYATMGALAFVLLMTLELGLAATFGESPSSYLGRLADPAGALGLVGQLGFGLIPWLQAVLARRH